MTRARILTLIAGVFWIVTSALGANRPNIIVILADDMGFSDIGCYGGEIQTPNIDRLASSGVRFTQFYNCARCCPSRASLLTGLYPHQAGIGHMVDDYAKAAREKLSSPAYGTKLNDRCVTIAEALGAGGYETMMAGKWHVGFDRDAWPDRRGFQRSFGLVPGAMNYFGNGPQVAGLRDPIIELDGEIWTPPSKGFYSTDAFTDRAIQFIAERRDRNRPFFLYLAYNAPHWPIQALPEDIEKYRGKYRAGFFKVRQARLQRQIEMELFPVGTPLPKHDAVAKWKELNEAQIEEWDLRMAIYAAQIDRMDQGIGRLLTALNTNGEDENTLILFLSDNGACHEAVDDGEPGALLGTRLSYSSCRRAWAQVSNTPFRLFKHWTHEGGIATPLIVNWPARFTGKGDFIQEPGHVIDIMATALDAAGVEYPKTFANHPITPAEGISLLPLLSRNSIGRNAPLFWEHEGNRAVRDGNWKLVSDFPGEWQLYDLEQDRTETTNLAASQPARVESLAAKYIEWAKRCDVQPWERTGVPMPDSK